MLRHISERDTKKTNVECNWRPWADLPGDLLDVISMQLHMMDHQSFSGVCKSWRAAALERRKEVIASHPPFIAAIRPLVRGVRLTLCDIFDGRTYRTDFPTLHGKFCSGFCGGYLMMEDLFAHDELWLVNPFTRHELRFPLPPVRISRAVTTCSSVPTETSIVALSVDFEKMLFYCPGFVDWVVIHLKSKRWIYLDLAVFNKKIYALTSEGKLWEVNPNSNFPLTPVKCDQLRWFDVMGLGRKFGLLRSTLHLVATEEELFVVNYLSRREPQVFKVEFEEKRWIRTRNLGDRAMFLSEVNCGIVNKPSKWGGRINSVNILDLICNKCVAVSMKGNCIGSSSFTGEKFVGGFPFSTPHWLFRRD